MSDLEFSQDEYLRKINADIGKQIAMELDKRKEEQEYEPESEYIATLPPVHKKKSKFKIIAILLSIVCVLGVVVIGVGNHMLNRINYESDSDVTKLPSDKANVNTEDDDQTPVVKSDKQVINILLIGEESMKDDRGRSDSMMVATINRKQKTLKLTSFMRDIYVTIPGYLDNKLNAAFHNGGGPLLADTIEQNFGISIDGYVRVDFDGFENVIDQLGGVELTLSESEAQYLNTTNYISDPAQRNVVVGKQTLTGNQALGYSRVRYRKTSDGQKDDFGRTSRQRTVLTAIFNKYKSKNLVELIGIANDVLPLVTTNMKKSEILDYLTAAVTLNPSELETFRIPIDGSYAPKDVQIGSSIRDVLEIDKTANMQALQQFIYEEGNSSVPSQTPIQE